VILVLSAGGAAAILWHACWNATPPLIVGEPAPDFELPRLNDESVPKDQKLGLSDGDRIRLSSFRGDKIVCLFVSSYT
jgi:hypothetical protein